MQDPAIHLEVLLAGFVALSEFAKSTKRNTAVEMQSPALERWPLAAALVAGLGGEGFLGEDGFCWILSSGVNWRLLKIGTTVGPF